MTSPKLPWWSSDRRPSPRKRDAYDTWVPIAATIAVGGLVSYWALTSQGPSSDSSPSIQNKPCEVPIEYRIGTIDSRFGINDDEVRSVAKSAGDLWGHAIGRPLFRYNPYALLTIDFVYDGRQEITQAEFVLKLRIQEMEVSANQLKEQISRQEARLRSARKRYEAALDQHNAQVDYWNSQGGAPEHIFSLLASEQNELDRQRSDVNSQIDGVNELIAELNQKATEINAQVDEHNNSGLVGTEFGKGRYVEDAGSKRIEIYQYETHDDLLVALAHELGHALGLDHTGDPNSVMSPLIRSGVRALTPADLKALTDFCSIQN